MTVAFERELFTRAVRRLPPFDLQTLLGLALLADPMRHELSGPWDAIAENLGVPPLLLPPVLARLQCQGYVRGRVDAPEEGCQPSGRWRSQGGCAGGERRQNPDERANAKSEAGRAARNLTKSRS